MASILQLFLGNFLYPWLDLFAVPFRNFDMLWITIPVILNWVFTEFYQEKHGTSLGNAISNGIVVLWVGVDWSRTVVNIYVKQQTDIDTAFFTKIGIAILVLIYGLWIVIQGIRVKRYVSYFGRVRQVTYILLVFTPIYYGVAKLTLDLLLAIILLFFPVYFLIEIVERMIPTPKTYEEEEKIKEEQKIKATTKSEKKELKEMAKGYRAPEAKSYLAPEKQYSEQYPYGQRGYAQTTATQRPQQAPQQAYYPRAPRFPAKPIYPRHPQYEKAFVEKKK